MMWIYFSTHIWSLNWASTHSLPAVLEIGTGLFGKSGQVRL